jgi:hypothetical protein
MLWVNVVILTSRFRDARCVKYSVPEKIYCTVKVVKGLRVDLSLRVNFYGIVATLVVFDSLLHLGGRGQAGQGSGRSGRNVVVVPPRT